MVGRPKSGGLKAATANLRQQSSHLNLTTPYPWIYSSFDIYSTMQASCATPAFCLRSFAFFSHPP